MRDSTLKIGCVVTVSLICACGIGAMSYTNTWNAAASATALNWGDPANWKVGYGSATTAPESAVPTAESLVNLGTANITLLPAGTYAVGPTYFCAGKNYQTLNLEIPSGSTLSLEGTNNASHIGSRDWQGGTVNNKVLIDVNGGTLNVAQEKLWMRPLMDSTPSKGYADAGYSHIKIRNGGTLALSGNATLRMFGGSTGDSQGRGTYTNIIDVLKGSKIELREGACLDLGGDVVRKAGWLHTGQPYHGGGWVNVAGGEITSIDPTFDAPLYMASHSNAGIGTYLNITDGGKVDLGGKSLYMMVANTNVISVASGGILTNFAFSVQRGGGTAASYHNLLDVDGGTVTAGQVEFGTASPEVFLTGPRMTFRVRGEASQISVGAWAFSGRYTSASAPPIFFDMRLAAHASRDVDFAIKPIVTRVPGWASPANGYSVYGQSNKTIPGIWRLSPEGGMQIVHRDSFELLARSHDGQKEHAADATYGGLIGEDMWKTNTATPCASRFERLVGYKYAYTFGVTLRDEAKLEDGVALAEARPRGWLALPTFTEAQLKPERVKRVSVRMGLEAPVDGTLDLEGVVARLKAAGHDGACADASVAGYNVRVDLPLGELKAGVATDKALFDFVSCETFGQAAGAQPLTTNALIRVATVEYVKDERCLCFILR